MISTTDRPFDFFFYLINNFDDFIENDFYENYRKQLNIINIDKENGIISHFEIDDDNNHIVFQETLQKFLKKKITTELKLSKKLIADNYRKLISGGNSFDVYLEQNSKDLIAIYSFSKNIKNIDLSGYLQSFICDFYNNFKLKVNFPKELTNIVSNKKSASKTKEINILSFKWNPNKTDKIELLYNKLANALPPFIDTDFEIFKKGFTGQELESSEGIKWICLQSKNKKEIAKKTLVCLIDLLHDAHLIISDKNDFNKIIENIFLNPQGIKLSNIKGSRAEKSINPTRIKEIQVIVNSLS